MNVTPIKLVMEMADRKRIVSESLTHCDLRNSLKQALILLLLAPSFPIW
jgi:hypothetical protein